ncbi:uncharacterized protein si:dkey-112a7.4 [Polyodon spathula]|uniref:uncharacterized protein si:dkey-112a7.4 n=1 Tax=Polyodon spathula TaxID=7913 RepID=UPI001B7E10A1|nr:uncharacterized protein si:dkey-112a7.4 [Polyodon spathula]
MIYCCARKESPTQKCVLVKKESERQQRESEQKARAQGGGVLPGAEEMHGVAGVSGSPQAGGFQPGQALCDPRQAAVAEAMYNQSRLSFDSPQRRLGKRAPKLGDIGRSKKVVIEDEELDDVLNNNGIFPLGLTPVA